MTRGGYTGLEASILYYTGQKKENISSFCFKKKKGKLWKFTLYLPSAHPEDRGRVRPSTAIETDPAIAVSPERCRAESLPCMTQEALFLWEQRTKWWWASSFLLPCSQCSLNSMMPLIGLHGISEQEENRTLIFPKRKTRTIKDDLLMKKSFYTIEGKK